MVALSSTVLTLDARRTLYELIRLRPGLHYREIQRAAALPTGQVSYHLGYLMRSQLIKEQRDGNYVRYFALEYSTEHEELLMLVRQRSVRAILIAITTAAPIAHAELAAMVHLSESTTTWHVQKLITAKIITAKKQKKHKYYTLNIPQEVLVKLFVTHRESFLDSLVDGLVELLG